MTRKIFSAAIPAALFFLMLLPFQGCSVSRFSPDLAATANQEYDGSLWWNYVAPSPLRDEWKTYYNGAFEAKEVYLGDHFRTYSLFYTRAAGSPAATRSSGRTSIRRNRRTPSNTRSRCRIRARA